MQYKNCNKLNINLVFTDIVYEKNVLCYHHFKGFTVQNITTDGWIQYGKHCMCQTISVVFISHPLRKDTHSKWSLHGAKREAEPQMASPISFSLGVLQGRIAAPPQAHWKINTRNQAITFLWKCYVHNQYVIIFHLLAVFNTLIIISPHWTGRKLVPSQLQFFGLFWSTFTQSILAFQNWIGLIVCCVVIDVYLPFWVQSESWRVTVWLNQRWWEYSVECTDFHQQIAVILFLKQNKSFFAVWRWLTPLHRNQLRKWEFTQMALNCYRFNTVHDVKWSLGLCLRKDTVESW